MMFGQAYKVNLHVPNHGLNNILIYALVGDSLTEGVITPESSLDAKYQAADHVMIYYKPDMTSSDNGSWQVYKTRANPTINRSPGNAINAGGPYTVGPDQAFVYGLDQSTLKKSIAIVKLGEGGSMLTARTGADNDWVKANGELYTAYVNSFFNVGMSKLYTAGYRKPIVKAIIVRLGTNDAATSRWNQAAFVAAIPLFCAQLRADLGRSDIPIYWVQVRTDLGVVVGFDSTSVGQCRTALVNCKSGGSTQIAGFNLIETYDSDTTYDGVHQSQAASISQGENESAVMISLGE